MKRLHRATLLVGLFLFLTISFLPATSSNAKTWYITVDGTGDAPTIQGAVDSAGMDDTILVAPGTYTWSNQGSGDEFGMVHMMQGAPALTIVSEAGPEMTILDAEYLGRVFFFQGHYASDPGGLILDGFTLTRGVPTQTGNIVGGGFTAHLSSPILRNCIFRDCHADQGGGLWYGGMGHPQLINCVFEYNSAYYGGGIMILNSAETVIISDCVVRENTAESHGGGILAYNIPFLIQNCVVTFNTSGAQGGGIAIQKCYPSTITQTTIHKNLGVTGGGIAIVSATALSVDHSIISYSRGGGSAAINPTGSITFSCTDIFANGGANWIAPFAGQQGVDGNFQANALFCDISASSNLELEADSPCAPGNHPDGTSCGLIGARPVGCGGVPTENKTWGALKSLYTD